MGRTPASTWGLARHLRRVGHTTASFGYVAALESLAHIRKRLRDRLEVAAAGGPYAVIGHSLGGLLLRHALDGMTVLPRHLIMLATPNQPSRIARRVRRWWPFRLATGEAGQLLSDPTFFADLPVPAVPYTIVAGTAGPRGPLSPFGNELNDWLVAVSETHIRPDDRPVLVPVEHPFMMLNTQVRTAITAALASVTAS